MNLNDYNENIYSEIYSEIHSTYNKVETGKRIRHLIDEKNKQKKFTQKALSDVLYIKPSNLNQIINGKKGLTKDNAIRIANYFNVSVFWLFGLTDNPTTDITDFDTIDYSNKDKALLQMLELNGHILKFYILRENIDNSLCVLPLSAIDKLTFNAPLCIIKHNDSSFEGIIDSVIIDKQYVHWDSFVYEMKKIYKYLDFAVSQFYNPDTDTVINYNDKKLFKTLTDIPLKKDAD